ncbi:hypothetical protein [Aeromicrobium sp. P5_D10]
MKKHMTRTLITLLAVGSTVAACAESDSGSESTAESAAETTGRTATATAQPRLVIGSDAGVEIVAGADLKKLDQYDLASRPKLQVAGDGRHVFVLQSDAKKVGVVDAGTWSAAHGDHSHSYVTAPSLLDTDFDRGTSYHAVSDDERSIVWFDDDGSFEAFDWKGLEDDDVSIQRVETGSPHHGVAAPTSDGGFLASYPEGEDAAGVLVLDADGKETGRIDGCEGLHGETHTGEDAYAFGCSDGVLVVDDGKGSKIESPVKGAGTSTLVGDHESDLLVGNLSSEKDADLAQQIVFYDVEAAKATAVDLGVAYSGFVRADGQTVALGTDGALHVVDEASGKVVEKFDVVKPWELTEEYSDPKPQVAVGGGFAWVTDPRDKSVALFELGTGKERTRVTLDDVPTSLTVVNAPHVH